MCPKGAVVWVQVYPRPSANYCSPHLAVSMFPVLLAAEMFAARIHFLLRFYRSVVLRDSLWPLCRSFRNLTQRTQRKATESTEDAMENTRNGRCEEQDHLHLHSPYYCRNVFTARTSLVVAPPRSELEGAMTHARMRFGSIDAGCLTKSSSPIAAKSPSGSYELAVRWASLQPPSIVTPTALRCTFAWPTKRTRSARRLRARAISGSTS